MTYFKAKENEARALLLNCPVSRKFGNELAKCIRNKTYPKAMAYIEAIMEKKRYLPLARFNDDVGHRPGMEGNVKSGRYPIKLAGYFKKALELAKNNAENKGLDGDDLLISGCVVNTGVRRVSIQPGGRRRMRRTKSAHIEVLLRQKHKLKAKKEDVKVEPKVEKKDDAKVEPKVEKKVVESKDKSNLSKAEKKDLTPTKTATKKAVKKE